MDDALVLFDVWDHLVLGCLVLILVLMDDALVLTKVQPTTSSSSVLILVLMDDALVLTQLGHKSGQ